MVGRVQRTAGNLKPKKKKKKREKYRIRFLHFGVAVGVAAKTALTSGLNVEARHCSKRRPGYAEAKGGFKAAELRSQGVARCVPSNKKRRDESSDTKQGSRFSGCRAPQYITLRKIKYVLPKIGQLLAQTLILFLEKLPRFRHFPKRGFDSVEN